MTHRPRVRSLIAATTGAALLALGSGLVTAAPASAAPNAVAPAHNPNYPLGGDAEHPGTPEKATPQKDQRVEKAEKLGGGTATKIIELGANILKCGLNIVAPTVKCE
ncbi:hypothetical protein [Nocardia spumae]|uniref:hypothetical protein n=1 Tax=Nocardia spumae TaxID=2887190 RepID=UPI001D13ADB6|nr:hypothetical protein [Nocardia spumae]